MSHKLIVNCPINSLSLGNVSYNILRELHKRKIQVVLFPIQYDVGAYNIAPEFKTWLEHSINNRYTKFNKDIPSLKIWHMNGAESKFSNRQFLFTFHETDSPTPAEINIVNQQEKTFFSSNWSKDNFELYGGERIEFIPLGFDHDFKVSEKRIMNENITHWLIGPYKFEKRKMTQKVIELWVKKYGNNNLHQLTVAVTNPFLNKSQTGIDTNDLLNATFKGQKPTNVNIIGYMKLNAEVNSTLNAADINLSGLAAAEGWNLPAFNSVALGKFTIVTNVTAHKDWANSDNSILVEPNGIEPVYDGMFFHPNQPFNQGNYFKFDDDAIVAAFEVAEKQFKEKKVNTVGLELQKLTYSNTVDKLLSSIGV